jgi:phage replication-related protein YjqB (UPF0714/DUF867 family)
MDHDIYANFAALKAAHAEGQDFRITAHRLPDANVAIVAPHAGGIEFRTSDVAMAIAGKQHSLYLFEGTLADGNMPLHITSHHFDEPRCLELLNHHEIVVSIHGCGNLGGRNDAIYIGGLDDDGKERIAEVLRQAMFEVHTQNHRFPGTEAMNICNRGASKKGVQLELSRGLRDNMDVNRFAAAVRNALHQQRG